MGTFIIRHYRKVTCALCALIFVLSLNIAANVSAAAREQQVRAEYTERDRRLDSLTYDIFVTNYRYWMDYEGPKPDPILTLKDARAIVEESMK